MSDLDINAVRAAILNFRAMFPGPVTCYLNAADLAALTPEERQVLTAGGGIRLEADPRHNPGGYSAGRDRS